MQSKLSLDRAAYYLTCASVVSMLFSIAIGEILLALAVAALLFSRERMRFPPILWPIVCFFAATVISMALSADPWSGRSQIRKFVLYFFVPLIVYSTVRTLPRVKALLLIAVGVAALSSLWSFVQFAGKMEAARELGRPFYAYYTSERITGFMSHWMTEGGEQMIVFLMGTAMLFFFVGRRWLPWLIAALAIILGSLVLGYTRSIWFGTFLGGVYLLWIWRRWWVMALPVPLLLMVLLNPFEIRERVRSVFQPHGDTDSNQFRYVCRRAGWEMIKAHPWFGLGPEQPRIQFLKWVPADIPRPLPTGWYGHLHNIYIHFAAERGVPAMLILLWLFAKILYDFFGALPRARDNPVATAILHGGIAVMIGMLAVGFYEVNIGDSEVLTLFLAVVSCGYVAVHSSFTAGRAHA
jgi:putative inorganic carbon (hco3(-)) transporter